MVTKYRRQESGDRNRPLPERRAIIPPVHSVTLTNEERYTVDGTRMCGVRVDAIPSTYFDGIYEVWWRASSPNAQAKEAEWQHIATGRTFPIHVNDPAWWSQDDGLVVDIAVVTVTSFGNTIGPDGSPQASITMPVGGEGEVLPPDVADFDAEIHQGNVYFSWTPVNPQVSDVMKYEIRSGSTGWSSGSFVAAVGPRNRRRHPVPRPNAPGSTFMIKAVTYSEVYSKNEDTATLTAIEQQEADEVNTGACQEVTIPAGSSTVTVTTRAPWSGAPCVSTTASDGSIQFFGVESFSQNGDGTWSFTLMASSVSVSGSETTVLVTELAKP